MPTTNNRWRWCMAMVAFLLTSWIGSRAVDAATSAQVGEYDLKAALVYRTSKFIEWPASAFAEAKSPFVVCVVSDNTAVLTAFRALESKTIGARAVNLRRITGDMLDLRQCHAAYFAADAAGQIDYAADKLEGAPVLTVGNDKMFVERGGMLALIMNPERVSFLVNLSATKRARLGVSSQLLQLAAVYE
jgi:hypothetical protein